MVTVPLGVAPKIDGIADAGEWDGATLLSDFQNARARGFVTQESAVRMLHDGDTLYILAVLKDFSLTPESNMLAEFKANLKGRQQPVWNDDCFELRIVSPEMSDGEFFYLGTNANGATYATAPEGFDSEFDKRCQLKTSRSAEGCWFVELAMPLSLFGYEKATPGQDWRINFIRFQQRLEEKSSWAQQDFHDEHSHYDVAQMGVMRFGDDHTPVVIGQEIREIGERLGVRCSSAKSWEGALRCDLGGADGVCECSQSGNLPAGTSELTLSAPAQGKDVKHIQYQLSCDGEVFFISPFFPSESTRLGAGLKLPDAVRSIKMNGRPLDYAKWLSILPEETNSLLEITAVGNTLRASLSGSGIDWSGKWEAFDGTQWVEAEFQNGAWTLPKAKGDVQFRKRIWSKSTKLATTNKYSPNYPITAEDAWILKWEAFSAVGWDKSTPQEGLKLHLFFPRGMKLIGASSRVRYPEGYALYNFPPEQNSYAPGEGRQLRIAGEEYTEYVIERTCALKRIPMFAEHQEQRERCSIAFAADASLVGKELPIYYYAEAEDSKITEAPRQINVSVLPPLRGVQPKKAWVIRFVWYDFNDISDAASNEGFMKLLQHSGINYPWMENRNVEASRYGLNLCGFFYYDTASNQHWMWGGVGLKALTDKYPEAKNGDTALRMVWLNRHQEEAAPFLEETFASIRRNYPQHRMMCWDYETKPFEPSGYVEFSPETLAIFAEEYGIAGPLTKEIVLESYRRQWVDFLCREVAESAKIFRKVANRHDFLFAVYSGYQCEESIMHYALDWRYLCKNAIDMAIMGYGRDKKLLADSQEALDGTPSFYGVIGSGDATNRRSTLLRRLIDSRGNGVLTWPQYGWTGIDLTELAETTRFFSQYEEIFRRVSEDQPFCQVIGTDSDNVVSYKDGEKKLVVVLNESAQAEIEVTITLPSGSDFTDFYAEKQYAGGQTYRFSIPAGNILALSNF